ncbi:MAG TPA: NUDIX hydrolase [Sediminibacterium sp.]|jgi:8-oxo-dGTP pyrophosphatase MutT (NUDIX family)|nr:MAG: DNA mismatch repair protein MutT [Sphingobacteriia bacterium 35-40-5]OYZ51804.1 MAG: DNA mismatch repair protein MutT [Sphingobacteriia bacterium 24-36-13]OZA64686.1 MAG: DNA mismatch repair protein MutT [Sphingobacteriia bacterium 39-39-8]HQR94074.1 NUDIX hydrolase [Sediminibacterium sp.]HQS56226.1 NUDIX hydrolase [Sediminibacterium sp.]
MNQEENPWKTLSSKSVYENPWIQLTEFDVVNPGGGLGIYGKVHFKNRAVGVMVLDAQRNTYLVGQFRYTLDEYSWEIPEGGGPIGLDPLDSAKRELLEETGLVAQNWELLLEMHLSNSVSDELAILYLATELAQFESEPEQTEQLQIKKLPFDEAYQMVMDGRIKDSMSVAAIQKTKLLFLEGKLK